MANVERNHVQILAISFMEWYRDVPKSASLCEDQGYAEVHIGTLASVTVVVPLMDMRLYKMDEKPTGLLDI